MEIQSYEFTVEDILNLHRPWITKLYINDKKTPVEIVGLLDERKLFVSLSQIQLCLREWDLVAPDHSTTTSTSGNRTQISGSKTSPATLDIKHNTTDPETVIRYSHRPLPSLPSQAPSNPSNSQIVLEHHRNTNLLIPVISPAPTLGTATQNVFDDLSQQICPQVDEHASATISSISLGQHPRAKDLNEGSLRKFAVARERKKPRDRSRRKRIDD